MKAPSALFAPASPEKIPLGASTGIDAATGTDSDAWLLRNFVSTAVLTLHIERIATQAAFRHMRVPRGGTMSVATTNCGSFGWVSDTRGYRYAAIDPLSDLAWPAMPDEFSAIAANAALEAGFGQFQPDACLINRYQSGARMGMHQDVDERDFAQPIVSVSIGASAIFMWGGVARSDPFVSVPLNDGDVVVWGGAARKNFHGVRPLKAGEASAMRYNLTMRRAR